MCFYDVCRDVVTFREIEEMEENLILPTFWKLRFVDINKPFWKKLMHIAFLRAKAGCDKWHDYEMTVAPYEKNKPIYYEFTACPAAELPSGSDLRTSCPPCAMWTMRPWNCSMPSWCERPPAWTAADATTPSAATRIRT